MRLIDADALLQSTDKESVHAWEIALAPTVEVVAKNETTTEVVRCKDCVYCKRFNDVWYMPKKDELLCTLHVETYHTTENDFCSWGAKMDEVEE